MITTIHIKGLRGIREGLIEGLAPLTLLVGPNGSGKSTVLEALGVACAGLDARAAFSALAGREWLGLEGVKKYWFVDEEGASVRAVFDPPLPSGAEAAASVHFSIRADGAARFSVSRPTGVRHEVSVGDDGSVGPPSHAQAPLLPFALQGSFADVPAVLSRRGRVTSVHREALARVKLSPWYDDWFENLKLIRPNITSIESIAIGDRDEPHVFEKPRAGYPLAYAGDGFRRALLVAAAFAEAKGGVAAIDEPEAFGHPTLFAAHGRLARRAIDEGTQVLMATQSLEFVAAMLHEFEECAEKVAVVGLRMEKGELDPVVVRGAEARVRVLELGHDLRL